MIGKRIGHTFLFIVVAATLFAGGIIFDKFYGSGEPQENVQTSETDFNPNAPYASGTTTIDKTTQGTLLESCTTKEKRLALEKKINYEPGTLLVAFKPSITFSNAKTLLGSKGLKLHTSSDAEMFESNHWLMVLVPKREEFDWMCSLKSSSEVKNVTLNPLFDLAE